MSIIPRRDDVYVFNKANIKCEMIDNRINLIIDDLFIDMDISTAEKLIEKIEDALL